MSEVRPRFEDVRSVAGRLRLLGVVWRKPWGAPPSSHMTRSVGWCACVGAASTCPTGRLSPGGLEGGGLRPKRAES